MGSQSGRLSDISKLVVYTLWSMAWEEIYCELCASVTIFSASRLNGLAVFQFASRKLTTPCPGVKFVWKPFDIYSL